MKLLVDNCVSHLVVAELREAGHDVTWVGDWDPDPGDPVILSRAHREHRIVITIDKDFGGWAVLHGQPHSGIMRRDRHC